MREERPLSASEPSFEDKWILSRLNTIIKDYTAALAEYRFGDAAEVLQGFFWHEVCDWYIEIVKGRPPDKMQTLLEVIDTVVRLFHPMMPFVTEEIWQQLRTLPGESGRPDSIMQASWPTSVPTRIDASIEGAMDTIMKIVRGVRDIRAKMDIARSLPLRAVVSVPDEASRAAIAEHARLISVAAVLSELEVRVGASRPPASAMEVIGNAQLFVPLAGVIDKDAERARIASRKEKCEQQLAQLRKKLDDKNFFERAPEEVVEREKDRKAELEENLAKLDSALAEIETW